MAAKRDPWTVLGVTSSSSPEAVRKAYLALVRVHHPDRYPPGSREARMHEERMKEITEAYQAILHQRLAAGTGPAGPRTRPRPTRTATRVRWDPQSLHCITHGRWAVIFCLVCDAPLCSRCDPALTGYCRLHRRGG